MTITGGWSATIALLLWGIAAGLLWKNRGRLTGTTLTAPWAWCLAAFTAVVAAELAIATGGNRAWGESLRYAAAVASFCPLVGVLGAKRPQDWAWQWIVASLWAVLAVPSVEALLFRPGQPLYLVPAWSWLLLALWLLTALNYLATRFWPSCLLVLTAQALLLADYSPLAAVLPPLAGNPAARLSGLLCAVSAIALVAGGLPRRTRPAEPLDRVWRDFRDAYGAAWTLRIAQRLRETAHRDANTLAGVWHSPLGEQPITAAERQAIEQSLRALLARFVCEEWIARRLR